MAINYDPDQVPKVPRSEIDKGAALGLFPVVITCDPRGAKVGDVGGVQFSVWVNAVPRIGESIRLEDGKWCQVTKVTHCVVNHDGIHSLMPNVLAVLLGSKNEEA
ncbi:MAG TPA: hypothetical protein VM165_16905 [Planctomycetaceae bacterium]|nr:hypothetical protein [Planctomycetaceae bacterium]